MALRNSPVAVSTPWLCRSKANPPPDGQARVWQCGYGLHQPITQHAPDQKGRTGYPIAKSTCTGVCNDILPFATLSGRGAQCAPGQRKIIRFVGEHSDSLRAACGGCLLDAHCGGCVRPYGEVGVDEFTSGVPRSYPRAPSLAALPQFTLAHLRDRLYRPKNIFSELTTHGQFFI